MVTSPKGGVYLNTRVHSRRCDYRFVGRAPSTSWWRAYSGLTSFEQPTVLVESDGETWRLYASGIGSERRDAVGTVVRYTVVLEGKVTAERRAELATAVVGACLADQVAGTRTLGAALDGAFPEADIERLYAATSEEGRSGPAACDEDPADEVRRRLVEALHTLPPLGSTTAAPPRGEWLERLDDPASRDAFLRLTSDIMAGAGARAAELNLVDRRADLEPLLEDDRPLTVLAHEPVDTGDIAALRSAAEPPPTAGGPGKAPRRPAPAGRTPPCRRGRTRLPAVIVIPALMVLMAAVLAVLLLT